MKFLKWLLIVLLVLAGLILIVPVFLPSVATVQVQKEIPVSPELIFRHAAQYTDRAQWDPWLEMEPDAKVSIVPEPDYVGSTYTWNGEKIGSGKMRVDSVHSPDFISSSIWFGDMPDPSTVHWILEPSGEGTLVTWEFISKGSYPFGRIMLLFMKGALRSSFETGLENYKRFLEENPPLPYHLSDVGIENSYATDALVLPAEGPMDQVEQVVMDGIPMLAEEIREQGLGKNGPPFIHVLTYDQSRQWIEILLAYPVKKKGVRAGEMYPKQYDVIEAVAVTLEGSYEYLPEAYKALQEYIADEDLEVQNESFEVFLDTGEGSDNPLNTKTMVAIPLK